LITTDHAHGRRAHFVSFYLFSALVPAHAGERWMGALLSALRGGDGGVRERRRRGYEALTRRLTQTLQANNNVRVRFGSFFASSHFVFPQQRHPSHLYPPSSRRRHDVDSPSIRTTTLHTQLLYDDVRGRHLAASRVLNFGDLVLVARPIATAVHGAHIWSTCHACLAHLHGDGDREGDDDAGHAVYCQVCDAAAYCDAACRAADAPLHALECALRCNRVGAAGAAKNINDNDDNSGSGASGASSSGGGGGSVGNPCALVADEVWTTRLLARAVAWSELHGGDSGSISGSSSGGGGGGSGISSSSGGSGGGGGGGGRTAGDGGGGSGDATTRDDGERGDVLWGLESRPNATLDAAAGGEDTLGHIARVMHGAGRAGGVGGVSAAAATVGALRHVHGVVVNNAVGVVRLPPRLTGQAGKEEEEGRGEDAGGSSTIAPRAVAAALYVEASMINHSCRPNCAWSFETGSARREGGGGGGKLRLRVVARHVAPGDALTVSYVHPLVACQPLRVRRERIAAKFGFVCRCDACAASETADDDGDDGGDDDDDCERFHVDEALADLRSFLKSMNTTETSKTAAAAVDLGTLGRLWTKVEASVVIPEHAAEEDGALLNAAWDVMNAFENHGGGSGGGGGGGGSGGGSSGGSGGDSGDGSGGGSIGDGSGGGSGDSSSGDSWPALSSVDILFAAAAACARVRRTTDRRGVGFAPDVLRARRLEKEWLGCMLSRGYSVGLLQVECN
jgi:hypothetical protein